MSTERFHRACDLYVAVAGMEEGSRKSYLDDACANDPELRAMVEKLTQGEVEWTAPVERSSANSLQRHEGWIAPGLRIVRVIGEGPLGTAYEAIQESTGRTVAVKLLRRELMRPVAESTVRAGARRLLDIDVPELAGAIDFIGFDDWRPCVVTELVEGKAVTEHADTRALGAEERLDLVIAVARAIDKAHRRGLLHGGLRPGNVLVDGRGALRILDLGLLQWFDHELYLSLLMDEGLVEETIAFLAPEQTQTFPRSLNERVDLYALGVLAFRLLCGRLPYVFQGTRVADHFRVIQNAEPEVPASVPIPVRRILESVVAKALRKNPEQRPVSVQSWLSELERARAELSSTGAAEGDRPFARRPIVRDLMLAGACIGCVVFIGLHLMQRSVVRDERGMRERSTALAQEKSGALLEAEERIEALDRERTRLVAESDEARSRVAALEVDQKSSQQLDSERVRSVKDEQEKNRQATERLAELSTENADLQKVRTDLEAHSSALESMLASIRQELDSMRSRADSAERLAAGKAEELDDMRRTSARALSEETLSRKSIEQKLHQKQQEVEAALEMLERERKTWQEQGARLQSMVATLEMETQACEQDHARLESMVASLTKEKQMREQKIEALDLSADSPAVLVEGVEILLDGIEPRPLWYCAFLLKSAALVQLRGQLDEADAWLQRAVLTARNHPTQPNAALVRSLQQLGELRKARKDPTADALLLEAEQLRAQLHDEKRE